MEFKNFTLEQVKKALEKDPNNETLKKLLKKLKFPGNQDTGSADSMSVGGSGEI